MKLKEIQIREAYSWENEKGPAAYAGKAVFGSGGSEVSLSLGDEASRRILAVIAEELVASSKAIADMMVRDVIETSGLQLEGPSDE